MQTNRGIAGKPLILLIIVLAIFFTIAAYLADLDEEKGPEIETRPIYIGFE